jgi:hypothetical protein
MHGLQHFWLIVYYDDFVVYFSERNDGEDVPLKEIYTLYIYRKTW